MALNVGSGSSSSDTLDVRQLTTDDLTIGSSSDPVFAYPLYALGGGQTFTTTSTSYTGLANNQAWVPPFEVLDRGDMALHGYYVAGLKIGNSSQTVSSRISIIPDGGASQNILEITHTGDTNYTAVNSGWTDVSSLDLTSVSRISMQLKSSGGATAEVRRASLIFAAK